MGRDCSVVKIICWFFRGSEFSSQHQYRFQLPVISAAGHMTLSFAFCEDPHVGDIDTHIHIHNQHTNTYAYLNTL